MKKIFAILFASTALTAAIGFPAWSAMHGASPFEGIRGVALDAGRDFGVVLVSDDDDGGDDHHGRRLRREDDDDEDDDDDSRGGNTSGPAPAGSAAPPKNGLFGNGATPKAQVN